MAKLAKLNDITFNIKIKNAKKIKKVTKSIVKMAKATEKAVDALRELTDVLPLICEIEQEEKDNDA